MLNILVVVALFLVPLCQLQVSHISCVSRDSVEIHFIANQSGADLSSDRVEFVMNDVSYTAPWVKTSGSAYHFSTVISVTGSFTATITSAYIQHGDTRIDAHNVPYIQTDLTCNPTAVTLSGLTARSSETITYLAIGVSMILIVTSFLMVRKR